MRFIKNNNSGFSLIEIMVGMVILGIGMCGLASVGTVAVHANMVGTRTTTASTLAQDKMESLKCVNFDQLTAGTITENYGSISNNTLFKRVTNVTINPSDSNSKTVTVTVYWSQDAHQIKLQTMVTKFGA